MAGAWLPDPNGRHEMRYWDGNQWTVHVATGGVQDTDVPPPPPSIWTNPAFYAQERWNGREHPRGTTVLVFGILGLAACTLLAPVAWVLGSKAKREMDAQPDVMWTNRGNITAGRICGIVGSCILIAMVALYVVLIAVLIATSE